MSGPRLETEARAILSRITEQGGMYRAIETGWVDQELENAAYRYQQEVERRQRIIVGSNAFIVPPEQDHEVPAHPRPSLRRLRDEAARGERHNLIPCLIDVVQAGVTLGEAVGVMREAYGHAWDPAGQLPSVF